MPFRQRSGALVYTTTNARSHSSASIRAHLLRVATPGRRFRRGSTLDGESRHDCARTARRPSTRRPMRARSAARSSFDGAYAVAQFRDHRGGGSELGGDREWRLERIGHRAIGPEEVTQNVQNSVEGQVSGSRT